MAIKLLFLLSDPRSIVNSVLDCRLSGVYYCTYCLPHEHNKSVVMAYIHCSYLKMNRIEYFE